MAQVAAHTKNPSTPSSSRVADTTAPAKNLLQQSQRRSATSDGPTTATKASLLTRPKAQRRGHSFSSSAVASPTSPQSRPKISPLIVTTSNLPSPSKSFSNTPTHRPSSELRALLLKRPPASRSCHGIETAFGPPPALSTQRAYSSEHTWKLSQNESPDTQYPKRTPLALAQLDAANDGKHSIDAVGEPTQVQQDDENIAISIESPTEIASQGMAIAPSQPQAELTVDNENERSSMEKRQSQRMSSQLKTLSRANQDDRSERSERSSQEDLFFSLAQSEERASEVSDVNQERRRVSCITSHIAFTCLASSGIISASRTDCNLVSTCSPLQSLIYSPSSGP